MCGRFTREKTWQDIYEFLNTFVGEQDRSQPAPNLKPRYNISPTQDVEVVRLAKDRTWRLEALRWGLVPSWAKGPDFADRPLINARAETVADKPSFRAAFKSRRCLVPADGFYEWKREGTTKQPYRICRKDEGLFAFAGIWERWEGDASGIVESFAIITTAANAALSAIHNRMPVIVEEDRHADWLETGGDHLLQSAATELIAYPVDTRVNSPRNDDPACIARMDSAVS